MFVADENLELLSTNSIGLRPANIVLLHDFTILDDPFEFIENKPRDTCFFSNHGVIFIIRIVGVPKLSVWVELKLKELVAELAFVADVIPKVEILLWIGHALNIK